METTLTMDTTQILMAIKLVQLGCYNQLLNNVLLFLISRQDFTVFGGSLSGAHAQKICKVSTLVSSAKLGNDQLGENVSLGLCKGFTFRPEYWCSGYGPGHDGGRSGHRVE